MSHRNLGVGLLFLFLAVGIALWIGFAYRQHGSDVINVTARNSWLRHEPDGPEWSQWTKIPEESFSPVPSANRDEAVRLLTDVSVVDLDDRNLKTFAPTLPSPADGTNPYLIRGVFLQAQDGEPMGTGRFECYRRGKDVLVLFGCLGRESWGTGKSPLVIWLPFKPEEIFVTCFMAE